MPHNAPTSDPRQDLPADCPSTGNGLALVHCGQTARKVLDAVRFKRIMWDIVRSRVVFGEILIYDVRCGSYVLQILGSTR